ncbi:HDOD domain-containing protein [Alkalilimnicola sp. S0819]|nr:HDOD domain-containing protein [Alkalilimnicola sp. S0819]MPQ15196.1 HDOD domain-containing protein [Alkalilimnicola sp. S0819]
MLEDLIPLRELDQEALEALADLAEYEDHPARSVVFRANSEDPWLRYLVSGSLVLATPDGGRESLVGMGDSAMVTRPLGLEQPFPHSALAGTDVRLLRMPRERVLDLLDHHRLPQYQVDVVDAENTEDSGSQLFYQLFEDLMEDRLTLPSMPDVAVRVRQAVSDPDSGAPEVAKIIQADPVVAARLMKVANSPAFGGAQPADSVAAAVVRLGLKVTREIVTAVTVKEVFKSSSPLINQRMTELWMRSTLIAALATVLARKLKGFSPDRALLAGLLHDIGAVPLLAHAHHYPELAGNPNLLSRTLDAYRGQVGGMLLRRWNFPEEVIAVPLNAGNWERSHEEAGDLADLVIVAQLQSVAETAEASRYPLLSETPAYRRLGLDALGISDSTPVMDEAREEIAEVQRLLMGK